MEGSKVTTRVVGAITVAMGLVVVLAGLGYLPHGPADPTIPVFQQQALAVCAGAVFAIGGLAAVLTTVPGRGARLALDLLGPVIVLGLTAMFAWVAVGPGSRDFGSPFAVFGAQVNAVSGRIAFGFGALLGLLILVLMLRGVGRTPPGD